MDTARFSRPRNAPASPDQPRGKVDSADLALGSLPRGEVPLFVPFEKLHDHLVGAGLEEEPLVWRAIAQARESHAGQPRDDGSSYLEQHVYPVTLCTMQLSGDHGAPLSPVMVAAALLHDALEDDPTLDAATFEERFGREVLDLVLPLTKRSYREFPGSSVREQKTNRDLEYHRRLLEAPYESKLIKVADRLNNISCSLRMPNAPKTLEYVIETEAIYLPLAEEVSSGLHERLYEIVAALRAELELPEWNDGVMH